MAGGLPGNDSFLHGILRDLEVTKYVGWPRHRSIEQTKAFLAFSEAGWRRWPAGPYWLLGGTGRIGKQIVVIALLEGPAPAEKFHGRGTASPGGNARNDSEALGCVGIKGIDCNGGLVEREGLWVISGVLVALGKIVKGE